MEPPTSSAAESIPRLRARQPVWIAIMVVFVLALIGGVVAYVVFKAKAADPGVAACARVEALAAAHPERAELADLVVARLVRVVESQMVQLHLTESEPVAIKATRRPDRCREALRVLDDGMRAGKYERLVDCMVRADAVPAQLGCLDDVGL